MPVTFCHALYGEQCNLGGTAEPVTVVLIGPVGAPDLVAVVIVVLLLVEPVNVVVVMLEVEPVMVVAVAVVLVLVVVLVVKAGMVRVCRRRTSRDDVPIQNGLFPSGTPKEDSTAVLIPLASVSTTATVPLLSVKRIEL